MGQQRTSAKGNPGKTSKIPLKNQIVIYLIPEAGRDCAISKSLIQ
jgi:hypothetical protein